MRRSIAVYIYDANPEIDSPLFYTSRCEADVRIDKGYAIWLSPKSIQTRRPEWARDESKLIGGAIIREAWKPRWGDRYIVLQLIPQGS